MQRAPTCENCQRNYELRECRPTGNRIPLLLPCGHTFCEGCILKATKNKTEVTCFNCEVKVQLDVKGEAGVKTLLPNIYLLGLLLYNRRIASDRITGGLVSTFNGIGNIIYKRNSSLSAAPTESGSGNATTNETRTKILCDECNLKVATCQCNSCDSSSYCESCYDQVHKTSKLLMKHTPLPIECSNKHQLSCTLHGRNLEFYDKDTSEAVCAICIISERCRGHDVILLSDHNIESDEINDAIEKANDTLFWWQHSSKVLTKALPEEYMEANQLFADIQSKFNACHTILLKRQLELMSEASEKIVASGSMQDMLQGLSDKIGSLTTLLKDVEMIMKDKSVFHLKSEEFVKKLNEFNDVPCIVQRTSLSEEDCFRLSLEDENITSIESMGEIYNRTAERFTFQKAEEVSDELKEQLKSGSINVNEDVKEEIKMNDILLEKDLNKKLKKFSLLTGYNELVCVTDVTNPADFKVQRLSDKDRLQVLMTDLNKYCRYANSCDDLIYAVEEGQLICAQFLSDNNWYRARVTNKWSETRPDVLPSWSNGLPVEVLYIDYGNTEWLPLTRLRQLPKQFLQIPEMAVTCMLTDIVPPCQSQEWPERSKKAFTSLTGDRPMLMNIRKRVGCKLHVDLRKPDDDEPTRDDDRPVSVRDALVFLEVAAFLSPASFPNSNMHQPVRKYKPHELLVEGEFVDMIVTHIEDPEAVYIQKLNSEIHAEQSRLGIVYNSRNKKGWMIDYPHRNLVCSARFSADKTWYRAKVLNVNHDDSVEVEYIDYGNRENVPFSDLRKIPDMYLEMPQQCVKAKLDGMKLPEGEESWPNESKEFLHKFFLGKPFVTVIKCFDDGVPVVEFYDTSTEADINMNELVRKFVTKSSTMNTEQAKDIVSQELKKMIATVSLDDDQKEESVIQRDEVKYACYLPPEIPNSPRFSATGVHVDDNATIYIHVMVTDNSCLTDIMQELNCGNKRFKRPKSTDELHPKQAIIAKFTQDNLWYRVEVVKVIDKKKVEVRYIDFGNVEEAKISDICMEPMFLGIAAQCISVQLDGVEPIENEWPTNVVSLLREYIVSEVVGVELKEQSTKEFLNAIIYVDDGTSINNILLKEKVVKASDKETVVTESKPAWIPTSEADLCNEISEETVHESGYLRFSEQRLPKKGLKFDVMVTQVNQPDIIYIQRLPLNNDGSICGDMENDETAEESYNNLMFLESFSEVFNVEGYFTGKGLLGVKPIVGMACISKYTSDGLYYRARIERLDEEEGMAEVVYIDYGTSELTPIENLIPLPSGLISLPMQAMKVCITGIKPILCEKSEEKSKSMLKDTEWSIDAMKHFYSIVANKRLVAEIVDSSCDIPKIHLYECVEKDGEVTYVYIGDKMKEGNFAEFEAGGDVKL